MFFGLLMLEERLMETIQFKGTLAKRFPAECWGKIG